MLIYEERRYLNPTFLNDMMDVGTRYAWSHAFEHAYTFENSMFVLTDDFHSCLMNINSWTLTSDFVRKYPALRGKVPQYEAQILTPPELEQESHLQQLSKLLADEQDDTKGTLDMPDGDRIRWESSLRRMKTRFRDRSATEKFGSQVRRRSPDLVTLLIEQRRQLQAQAQQHEEQVHLQTKQHLVVRAQQKLEVLQLRQQHKQEVVQLENQLRHQLDHFVGALLDVALLDAGRVKEL